MPIHDFLDESKAHFPDMRHRALLHNSWGIYLAERLFGHTLTNSEGRIVQVRDVAEKHIIEDMGRIPSVQDYLQGLPMYDWLGGPKRKPQRRTSPMFDKLNNLAKIHEEAMQRLQQEGEVVALREAFKAFFAAYPQITSIRWAQYTPYFNDGESCVFSVNEPELATDAEGDYFGTWDRQFEALPESLQVAFKELSDLLQSDALEPVLLAMFKDHAEITVTPTTISVSEYSHD